MKKYRTTALLLASLLAVAAFLPSCAKPEPDENGKTEENEKNNENEQNTPDAEYAPYPYEDLSVYIDVPDHRSVTLKNSDIENAVETEIQNYIISADLYEPVTDRAARNGDKVTIDYRGFLDDVPFDGGTATDAPLVLGSGSFVPGFEEGVVGMNIGDVKDVHLTFPENYYEDLAGKAVVFSVTLKAIAAPAEINDEFAKNHSEYDTIADLRAAIYGEMKTQLAFNALYSSAKLKDYPDEFMGYYDDFVAYFSRYADQYKMTLKDFVYTYGGYFTDLGLYPQMSEEAFYEAASDYSAGYTITDLIVYSVLRKENVTTGSEMFLNEKAAFLEENGKTYEELIAENDETVVITQIMKRIFDDILSSNVTVTDD